MKGANSDLTKSEKSAPPPALKAEFKDSTPKQSAEDVAETIFAALKNNNNPAPNHGLQVALAPFNQREDIATYPPPTAGDPGKLVTAEPGQEPIFGALHRGRYPLCRFSIQF